MRRRGEARRGVGTRRRQTHSHLLQLKSLRQCLLQGKSLGLWLRRCLLECKSPALRCLRKRQGRRRELRELSGPHRPSERLLMPPCKKRLSMPPCRELRHPHDCSSHNFESSHNRDSSSNHARLLISPCIHSTEQRLLTSPRLTMPRHPQHHFSDYPSSTRIMSSVSPQSGLLVRRLIHYLLRFLNDPWELSKQNRMPWYGIVFSQFPTRFSKYCSKRKGGKKRLDSVSMQSRWSWARYEVLQATLYILVRQ